MRIIPYTSTYECSTRVRNGPLTYRRTTETPFKISHLSATAVQGQEAKVKRKQGRRRSSRDRQWVSALHLPKLSSMEMYIYTSFPPRLPGGMANMLLNLEQGAENRYC